MTVLFFRVENVLNFPESEARAPDGRVGVVDDLVKQFKKSFDKMEKGTQLVLYGDWAKDWDFDPSKCTETGKYLVRKLKRRGLHIMDKAEGYDPVTDYVQRKHITEYTVAMNNVMGGYQCESF